MVVAALGLAGLWLLFSEKFDALHLGFGVVSLALTLWLCRSLLTSVARPEENGWLGRVGWASALAYPFWLLWQILIANVQMVGLILGPRRNIDPVLLRFETELDGAVALVALGNSITLTPGTFTLEIDGQTLRVHAITEDAARSPVIRAMERKLAATFQTSSALPDAPVVVTRAFDDPRFEGALKEPA